MADAEIEGESVGQCFIGKSGAEKKKIDRIFIWGNKRMQRKVQLEPKSVLEQERKDGRMEKISDVRKMV